MEIFERQMAVPLQLLSRCPSCFSNFLQVWCQFTCSPRQSDFLRVLEVKNDSHAIYPQQGYITRIEYHVNRSFTQGLFNSCKNVRTTSGEHVLASLMCGTSASKCTPERLFKYLGTYNKVSKVSLPMRNIAI